MRKDAGYLCSLRLARLRAKQVIEGADGHIDRIIWSVRENGGQVPNKLLKEFPALTDEDLAAEVVVAIRAAFVKLLAAQQRNTLSASKRPINLSITHNFFGDAQAEHDIGKACDPSPHDHVARWRIAFAREVAPELGDAGQVVGHLFA